MASEVVEFEQIVHLGCGIDVHKETIVATIDGVGLKGETRTFGATTRSLTELKEWLVENRITHVVMESTGVYWKPVYNVLESTDMSIWIVNARHVKYVPGYKTDKRDSKWLCKLLLAGLLKPSFVPPKEQRELRDLTRYRRKMIAQISSEKNRIIRILEDCNIKLSSVLSDTQGVVGTKIIDLLCKNGKISMKDIDEFYHGKLKASKKEIEEACEGVITEHHVFMLQTIRRDIVFCEEIISDITFRIKMILLPYRHVLARLDEIPGLDMKSIEDLVAEIGLDMETFPTDKHLASWAGVSPGNNESAGKKKSGRTTHGNKHVKTVLTEIGWAASRTKDTFYSSKYHRLAKRRGNKRAVIAVGHAILKAVYHVLKDGVGYNELGANYLDDKTKKKREYYLRQELEKLGYKVDLTLTPETEIIKNTTEASFADAVTAFKKEGMTKTEKTAKAVKKATKAVKTVEAVRATG